MLKFKILLLLTIFSFMTSCSIPNKSSNQQPLTPPQEEKTKLDQQIAQYLVEIFEDKKGNLWFGTMSKGVARYDGFFVNYLSKKDGLAGNTVASIAEDKTGNLWLGTHSGLTKYDGTAFKNFTKKDGLCHNRVSKILIDKSDNIWIGTWGGVCRFDGTTFSDFPIPNPNIEIPSYQETKDWVTDILEDQEGNIWISRSGYAVCKYNPVLDKFSHFTKKDGLSSNCVQEIHEDQQGNIWFGSRVTKKDSPDYDGKPEDGGLTQYDGKTFTQFSEIEGLSKNDIYAINEDKFGNIWIGANGVGVYKYDGKVFTLFNKLTSPDMNNNFRGIQSILEDQKGMMWFGFSGGLFQLQDSSINNVTLDGILNTFKY